ncbi:LysR family transcriptional regulator [Leptothrix discophora]|uniref:LysR family transcriptional regulator n=1 Tax=Leptothrix discophora TaxID=89 RepID=A0ABT9FYI2_LEPDI|nr:LysR family transcriptional regulator [Leptothrix discophora]MDP4299289.1 LysR family transcriptional regulator [Leptothrix discophora]
MTALPEPLPDRMPDAMPDLKLLRLFDVLYGTRSVTRAAEQLGQSQPTVSIWLGRLREQLGDPLFVRTPSGMQPTPRADALIGPTRSILESLRRLAAQDDAFDPATARRRLRICMTDASHITLLPPLLARVRAEAPGVQLAATRMDGDTAQALASGEADLAVGYAPWLETGIHQQTLFQQDWVCLASPTHPRLARRRNLNMDLSLDLYQAEPHVTIAAGTGAHLLDAALARAGVVRTVQLELPSFLGLAPIISATDLLATLPRQIGETLATLGGLKVFDCPVPVETFPVRQHWHARYHQDPGNQWLRGLMRELFRA